jgi:ABC-type branched-subunit amino acid transport system substrate-binding protein
VARLSLLIACLAAAAGFACAGLTGLPGDTASPEERAAYEAALEAEAQDVRRGEEQLEAFLRQWPESSLADDARVRLGDLALEAGDADTALRHFDFVVRNHPRGDQVDLARLRAAQILLRRGQAPSAERMLADLRLSRLSREEERAAYRALADAAQDPSTRLQRLAALRGFEKDEDALALVDVEIDRTVQELGDAELESAGQALGRTIPASRVWMRAAELALDRDDLPGARAYLDRAGRAPIAEPYDARLEAILERLRMREAGLSPEGEALPHFSELGDPPPPPTAGASGTLGVVLPLSGRFADFGEESLRGILLATGVFEAGAAQDVRVEVRDTAGRPDRAAQAVRELAQDPELMAIVGPLLGSESEAAAAAAERVGVPLLALTARDEVAATRPQVMRLRTRPQEEVKTLVEYAMNRIGAQTFAILYPHDDYGLALRDLFWDEVEKGGGAIVGVARYEPDATDFAEPIRRLVGYVLMSDAQKSALRQRERLLQRARRLPTEEARALRLKARAMTTASGDPIPPIIDFDALFIPESHEKVVLIAPQLAFHEVVGTRLLGPSGWYDPDLVSVAGRHVEGAVFTAPCYPDSPLAFVRAFSDGYQEIYGEAPGSSAAEGYDAASLVLVQLAEGKDDREAVRRGLLGVRVFPGVTGLLSMRADGTARKRPFLLGVEHGNIVELD